MANSKLYLPHPLGYSHGLTQQFSTWLQILHARLGEGPFMVKGYSKNDLPPADQWGHATQFTALIYIHDAEGGGAIAYSDGTQWLPLLNPDTMAARLAALEADLSALETDFANYKASSYVL